MNVSGRAIIDTFLLVKNVYISDDYRIALPSITKAQLQPAYCVITFSSQEECCYFLLLLKPTHRNSSPASFFSLCKTMITFQIPSMQRKLNPLGVCIYGVKFPLPSNLMLNVKFSLNLTTL